MPPAGGMVSLPYNSVYPLESFLSMTHSLYIQGVITMTDKPIVHQHPPGKNREDCVRQDGPAFLYRAQKSVEKTDDTAKQDANHKPPKGDRRCGHPISRRQKEPVGRGSS